MADPTFKSLLTAPTTQIRQTVQSTPVVQPYTAPTATPVLQPYTLPAPAPTMVPMLTPYTAPAPLPRPVAPLVPAAQGFNCPAPGGTVSMPVTGEVPPPTVAESNPLEVAIAKATTVERKASGVVATLKRIPWWVWVAGAGLIVIGRRR